MDNKSKSKAKKEAIVYSKKDRNIIAVLSSLTITFICILYGSLDIYVNNYKEYLFSLKDFIFPLLGIFILCFAALSFLIHLCKGRIIVLVSQLVFILITWSYFDTGIINKVNFAGGDFNSTTNATLSLVVLFVIFNVFYFISIKFAKKWKSIIIYLSVLFLAMSAVNLISDFIKNDFARKPEQNISVLSQEHINEVSDKENVIIFIVDRFDNQYVDGVEKYQPGFFDTLDGFTYYNDSISLYPRTFPSIAYLLSGEKYTGEKSPSQYLTDYVQDSSYLKDVKENNYNIRYYTQLYYGYTDASAMSGIVDNVEPVTTIEKDTKSILKYLLMFSFARNNSTVLQNVTYVAQNNAGSLQPVSIECENGLFKCDDYEIYHSLLENGLSVSGDDKDYIFIHLHGSHSPYIIDENAELSKDSNAVKQTIGCFKYITLYLNELKRLGAYDNSTIIITGDHGIPYSDKVLVTEWPQYDINSTSTAALFYKPKNAQSNSLQRSSLPVSAENLIPTIIEDTNMEVSKEYGTPISKIDPANPLPRTYIQLMFNEKNHKLNLAEFEVSPDAQSFDSWKYIDEVETPYIWY